MRIAQIAPLMERCPPQFYGGTERIVSYLTEELVRQGHDVTLFASGDSLTDARLVPCCEVALRLDLTLRDPLPHYMMMLEALRQRAHDFDVLHFHIDLMQCPLIGAMGVPAITTLHGRLDLPDLAPFYRAFPAIKLVSISADQRRPLPHAHWAATVPHGLPPGLLPFTPRPRPAPDGGYLAFLGRISPEKRPDRVLEIAAAAGMRLKIAAKIDRADQAYWDNIIAPMLAAHPNAEFVGEIGDAEKADFLGNAAALVFPIDWPEPFGLVMIEAMACGTPVIAFRCGAVPEIIEDGVSGYIVTNHREAVRAVTRALALDRAQVRAAFENRFTVDRMAEDYVALYQAITGFRDRGMKATNGAIDRVLGREEPELA
jgi:glycosyltransferase involved in cell wall biosynthesis